MMVISLWPSTWRSSDMRKLIIFFSLFMTASLLCAYDFPVHNGKITASFGSRIRGEFNTGIDIETDDVIASEAGEVLYYGDDLVAIAHKDNILTIYSGISVSETVSKDFHIKKGQFLGKTKKGVLHFAVYDLEMERYINPLLMTEAVKKSELPRVKGLSYDESQGLLSVQLEDKGLLGLYRVQVSAGGQVVCTLGFRTIQRKGDTLLLEGFTCSTLYSRQGAVSFPGIHLNQGINNIDVIVTDFYGKKVEFHGRITV